ncbi:hypothetical protein [Clostridium carboxidivorans]
MKNIKLAFDPKSILN